MVKMIKFKFNCSRTVIVVFLICSFHQLIIASSSFQSQLPIGHRHLSSYNASPSPKRRSFFESFKSSYSVIPNKLKQISIMNMLTGKRKNRRPADDEDNQLFYSEVVSNPAIFSSVYSEKLAPQFQSIFSELDESYAKNPPPNLGAQLALKPNGGLSFQPVIDLAGNHAANPNQNSPNNQNDQQTNPVQIVPVAGQIAQLSPISNQINQISNQITPISSAALSGHQPNANSNGKPDSLNNFKPTLKDNSVLSSNLLATNVLSNLNNLLGQQSSRNHFMFINHHRPQISALQLSATPQPHMSNNKLSETSLTAAASSSPFSKQHFSSLGSSLSNSLTTNLLHLKNKFSQQKNQNYLKTYKSYKDTMLGQMNGGAMLAAANQYQYFQQRPPNNPNNLAPTAYFQPLQASYNRYQMISSPSNMKKNCRKCPMGKKKTFQQQSSGYGGGGNFNQFSKGQDYGSSNLITNNVRQKQQFYSSMMQEKFKPMSFGGYTAASSKTNFNTQKQNAFYKPMSGEKGTQVKVGSDIITLDDIEQALRRNNLHKVTGKDAQVYTQLHNMLMNSINEGYQVDSKVNVEDGRASRMLVKGKIFDDNFSQSTKGWRPKITQQQEEIKQVKDEPLFDEPQIKETDQQQKINDEEDFNQIKETDQQVKQPVPVFTQQTNTQWQPVKKPTKPAAGGTKTPTKPPRKGGVKSPPPPPPPATKSPVKGTKSPVKLAKLQLASNTTDSSSDSGNSLIDRSNNTSLTDDSSKRETEDTTNLTSNNTSAALFTQTGQGGTRVIKKIKRRKKKRITSDKGNSDSLLTAVRKANKSQAAKLVANSFDDQVKTDVSSEAEVTTSSAQLIDSTTNGNNEVQFDDTTSVSEEQNDQRGNRITSTTVALNTLPNKQEQVKGMLAKKRKVMESITTTTESSDSLIESSPDTSRGLEETSNLESNGDNGDNTYFSENITDSNIRNFEMINNKEKKNVIFEDTSPFVDDLDNVRSKLKMKSAIRKKKVKSTNRNRALTSINSPFGDFTASISTDENDEDGGRRKKMNKNRVVEPDESIENMHFRIDDVDADDYDALNRENLNEEDKENDGFNNSFSNENTELSETRNQLNKIHPTNDGRTINQTLFNSLLKSNRLINSTHLGNVQPITTLHLKMNMNDSPDVEDEALDTMDVNSTIADLVQKIHQANGGDLNVINEYRNYFTEDEFDLLTDLLKREANKTIALNSTSSPSSSNKLSTSESIRKEQLLNHLYYTDYDERRSDALKTIATINSSSPIYLNGKGQASLKEYYFNKADPKPDGVDVLINIQERKSPIRGQPGVDYPIISNAPKKTSFSCKDKEPGLYADHDSGCIRYIQCSINVNSVQQQTFYCANGTLFDQRNKVCSWWYNVDCQQPDSPDQNDDNRMKSDRTGLSIDSRTGADNRNGTESRSDNEKTPIDPTNLHPVYVPNSPSN